MILGFTMAGKQTSDLILTMCPFGSIETPPIGIAILQAVLKDRGFRVQVVDLNAEAHHIASEEQRELWDPQRHILDYIVSERFDRLFGQVDNIFEHCCNRLLDLDAPIIGFSTYNTNARFSAEVARHINSRNPGTKILFGGPSCKIPGERSWAGPDTVDAFVVGDAEEVLPDLLGSLDAPPDGQMEGVLLGRGRDPLEPVEPLLLANLNASPIPDFTGFDLTLYDMPTEGDNVALPIVASRGCFMTCAYCNDRYQIKRYRFRSAEHIFAEMVHQHERHNAQHFFFNDSAINGKLKVLDRLADLIIERGLSVSWVGQAIPRGDMTAELLTKLRQAGLRYITFGVETGSPRIRKLMRRDHRIIDPDKAIRLTHQAGIKAAINLVAGFPGETEDDFQDTLDLVTRNRDFIDSVDNVHPCFVTPLSPMERDPAAFGIDDLGSDPIRRALTWTGAGGNTYALRKARVEQLAMHLADLGVPFDQDRLNLYEGVGEVKKRPPVWMSGVTFGTPDGEARSEYSTGDPIAIVIRYRVESDGLENPLFRVQIFNDENPDNENLFVYGTNTARFDLDLGRLAPGSGIARLVISKLNLLPGLYRVSTGIWPDEQSQDPYDVRHGTECFEVTGDSDPLGGMAHLTTTWTLGPGRVGAAQDTLTLLDAGGEPVSCFDTSKAMRARLHFRLASAATARVVGTIQRDGRQVHRAVHTTPLEEELHEIELVYESLDLLQGGYELSLSLEDPSTGDKILGAKQPFEIVSELDAGAGIVAHAVSWRIDPPR